LTTHERRVVKLQKYLRIKNIDCVLITKPEHIFYFSGYIPPEQNQTILVILQSGNSIMIVPEAEEDAARRVSRLRELITYVGYSINSVINGYEKLVKATLHLLKTLKLYKANIGVENYYFPLFFSEYLKDKIKVKYVDISPVITKMRMIKFEEEINKLEKAVHFCDTGQKAAKESISEGVTEVELFLKIRSAIETKIGNPIMLKGDLISGPGTELMGGSPGKRKIVNGDFVIVDIQPQISGYWGDTTRTMVFGKPTRQQRKIYNIVLQAAKKAIEGIKPGIKASEIDKLAREHIVNSGYGDYFPHHTGHGIGLEHFEPPLIIPGNHIRLKEGMVFTIEPGIYLPGFGGVRVEECVLVTEDGCRVLSKYKRSL